MNTPLLNAYTSLLKSLPLLETGYEAGTREMVLVCLHGSVPQEGGG
jgi:hypothetical protein